ncbi:MAG: hypothetical protein ACQ9MH_26520 [Nitrospinales bacterium]
MNSNICCLDECDNDAGKIVPGICGVPDADADTDVMPCCYEDYDKTSLYDLLILLVTINLKTLLWSC